MKSPTWLLACLLSLSAVSAADTVLPILSIGSPAPDFQFAGTDGKNYSLADFKSSPVLVVLFTCNHCPTAQYYEERIKSIVNDYRSKGVALVAISPNDPTNGVRPDELGYTDLGDSLEEMKIRAAHRGFNFPYLYGGAEHEAVSKAYGPVATPHAFVFDAERKLRYQGRIDDSEREKFVRSRDLRNALDALLAGQEPAVKQTKVIGCSIKWSDKSGSVKGYWDKLATEPVTVTKVDSESLRALRINEAGKNDHGKLRLINFWATSCGPCVVEFPELMAIHRAYRLRDFEVVTVAAQYPDEEPDVLRFLKKYQASTKNFLFGDTDKYKLIEAFDPEWNGSLPYTLLVDPAGEVLYRQHGSFDPLELKRTIVKSLNARKPW